MQIAQAVERNTSMLQEYGRYCSEMHKGISDNRTMICADREAASATRVQVAKLVKQGNQADEGITQLSGCLELNFGEIDNRFVVLEKGQNQ